MVSPIDYRLDVLNPVQQAMQGYNLGTQMAVNQSAIQAAQAEEARKQQQFLAQQEQQKAMYDFSLKPDKSTQDFVDFTVRYPQLTEQYKKSWEMMDTGQRADALKTAAEVMSAIKTNNPNVAQEILEERAKAYENSGQRESAFNMRRMKGMISKDPNSIYSSLGLFGSAVSPDEFGSMIDKFGSGVRADQMQPYEIAGKQAQTAYTQSQTAGQIIENRYKPQQIESDLKNVNSQISSRKADDEYKQQQLFFEKNKPVNFGIDKEGRKYAVMPNGEARYVKDAQGNYITDIKSEKPMTATMQKELFETDDAIASSQSVISNLKEALRLSPISYDGVNADTRASLAGNLGLDKERSKNTAMLNNIMTSNALDALKSTFGAAPTEGERKILLDIQGSVNLPAKQREAIYSRALQAATKRLNTNQKKADAIRGGSYTSSEYNNATAPQQQQASKPIARSFFD